MERISRTGQVKIYVGKCYRGFKNEKGFISLIMAAGTAFIIAFVARGGMFEDYASTNSGGFAIICGCIWVGIFNSIQSICREREIIKREYRTGLHISSYIIAHMIYEMALCLIEAIIVAMIFLSIAGNNLESSAYVGIFITFFLVIYSADVLAMIVSSIVKKQTAAMTAVPFVLIVQLVLAGVIFELSGPMRLLANFTISKWGVRAILSLSDVLIPAFDMNGNPVGSTNASTAWVLLCAFTVVYGALCVVFLKRVDKDKR